MTVIVSSPASLPSLTCQDLTLSYGEFTAVHDVSLQLKPGNVTVLIGPNGSGKSTVLRALARLHPLQSGRVSITTNDTTKESRQFSAREFAKTVAMLSQNRPHPSGIEVRDVVAYGRHPHRGRFSPLRAPDLEAIAHAMELTGLTKLANKSVDQLSGGELQRVWLATSLAQDTTILLLDEPTNHLDLRYQIETLDLMRSLANEHNTAIGVVLHDLDHGAAVADDMVLLHNGQVRVAGKPEEVLTTEHLSEVYGLHIDAQVDATTGRIRIIPRGRHINR